MSVVVTDLQVRGSGDRVTGSGSGPAMDEAHTPGSDCNSNPSMDPTCQDLIGSEFVHDNMDYQWFADCGYRDAGLHVHSSVLSSLSASYTRDDLRYDAECRYLDANFAEIDMENFRTADIHSLLTLPVICTDPVQHSESNYQRERYASMSGSIMEKLDFDSPISPHTSSQGEDSACSTTDTMSICKSSLLFSPVKETPVLPPGGSYSVDSLDCEDVLLTCQAHNKINYTIAFEGSMTMYSDGSQDFENQEKQNIHRVPEFYYDKKLSLKNVLGLSMARSDSKIYTTWSNLKHCSANNVMTRHPSGNNNTIPNFLQATGQLNLNLNKRSQSLPDLTQTRELTRYPLNFSVDSAESNNHVGHLASSGSVMSRSMNEDSSESVDHISTGKKIQNLSLVKRFMKQKSMSAEGMSMTLDQSGSASDGGWPTSNSGSASGSGSGTRTQILQHNINNTYGNQTLENDFAINWVKSDYYNNKGTENTFATENFDNPLKKQSPLIEEFEGESQSSASVEELSESTSKNGSACGDKCKGDKTFCLKDYITRSNKEWSSSFRKDLPISKTTGTQVIPQVEDNGVQTSLIYSSADHRYPPIRETVVEKKPAYIVYPNYALPDLSFLQLGHAKFDKVALKPQCFDRGANGWKRYNKSNRPFSCNDVDALKQRGFSHIKDWESLTFLLPTEYKKILYDVPEVSRHVKLGEETKKPLFCLSPQMRRQTRVPDELNPVDASSMSSTGTQPSSGYRGSSTILSDSSTNQQGPMNNTNPLYLYRYDSASSEASLSSQDMKQLRPSCKPKVNAPVLPKRSISLPHGDKETRCNTTAPPRPPLPRGILRKTKVASNKRYSMFEMGGVEEVEDQQAAPEANKRMSLQEPYYLNNDLQIPGNHRVIDSEKDVDEVEERRYYAERFKEAGNCIDLDQSEPSTDMLQLEDFLRQSGFSSQSSDGDGEDQDVRLRSYVRKFLRLKMNKDLVKNVEMMESNKKTVSFAVQQRQKLLENKASALGFVTNNQPEDRRRTSVAESPESSTESKPFDSNEKHDMLRSVNKSVGLILNYWHTEPIEDEHNHLNRNECAQLCLSNLCPALYALMSDGLRPSINSTFGPLANSVWQVVEASSQQGPLTKTLNELVQKINGEDFITEGMLKFHAFVFGLLNLRALDAWFAYLCTRESILRKHYSSNSLFVSSLGCANSREMVDTLLDILQPLSLCPFQLDMLYQYRQLHNSFGNINNHATNAAALKTMELSKGNNPEFRGNATSPTKARPRSCVGYSHISDAQGILREADLNNAVKKRWSNLPAGSKILQAFDKLALEDSEDYTDSLEHSPMKRAAIQQNVLAKAKPSTSPVCKAESAETVPGGVRFKKLQEKWELMIGKEESKEQPIPRSPASPARTPTSSGKSKIPRLLSSPTRQSAPNAISPVSKCTKSPATGIPSLKKPSSTSQSINGGKKLQVRKDPPIGRTSRVDQEPGGIPRTHFARPSSLPYKPPHSAAAREKNVASPHRRAASTSLPRPATFGRNTSGGTSKSPLKEVRTLTHRLPSDNGHLSFAEGERLRVILEVDNKWLLCSRGEHKGLVPRSCVHAVQT